jgi:hypothetical protein
MPKLPTVRHAPLPPELRAHVAETQRMKAENAQAKSRAAEERAVAEQAALEKTLSTNAFLDDIERRWAQSAAEGRERARMSLPMDPSGHTRDGVRSVASSALTT